MAAHTVSGLAQRVERLIGRYRTGKFHQHVNVGNVTGHGASFNLIQQIYIHDELFILPNF